MILIMHWHDSDLDLPAVCCRVVRQHEVSASPQRAESSRVLGISQYLGNFLQSRHRSSLLANPEELAIRECYELMRSDGV
jgi:hypothetical protein